MRIHFLIFCLIFCACDERSANDSVDESIPPKSWASGSLIEPQQLWDLLRESDGKVTADEVIEFFYTNHLSHNDGDSQLDAAQCLVQLPDDPLMYLRRMMVEDIPERRAYAVILAGILEDVRFEQDIKRLKNDSAKLGQFPGEWFWDTVSDAAEQAERSMNDGSWFTWFNEMGESPAPWLKLAKPQITEQAGTGQPATRPELESEGGDKLQPESEGRSR
jgi:hypothetical protein